MVVEDGESRYGRGTVQVRQNSDLGVPSPVSVMYFSNDVPLMISFDNRGEEN